MLDAGAAPVSGCYMGTEAVEPSCGTQAGAQRRGSGLKTAPIVTPLSSGSHQASASERHGCGNEYCSPKAPAVHAIKYCRTHSHMAARQPQPWNVKEEQRGRRPQRVAAVERQPKHLWKLVEALSEQGGMLWLQASTSSQPA